MDKRNTDIIPESLLLVILRAIFKFITSFKLATVILVLMTIVTLLGTLGQVEHGLHAAKLKYFHSWVFTVKPIGGIPIPFPGGILLMSILFVNMTCGALIKVRKRWAGAGLLISHIGMLLLLLGGFVTWQFSSDDYMALYPGMKTNRVESYREWQLEIMSLNNEGKAETLSIYPTEALQTVPSNGERNIDAGDFPFGITLSNYSPNATPVPVSAPIAASVSAEEVDGFKLAPQKPAKEAAQNLPGCYLTIRPKSGDPIEAILWAGSYKFDPKENPMPFTFEIDGKQYGALLAKKSKTVPFSIRLDKFVFEQHPGISTAREYNSHVTRFEEGKDEQALEIRMNEPMRYQGYTFFQESFGPPGSRPGDEMYSQFAVANNPADQWPLIALSITGAGLLIHFVIMLVGFMIKSARKNRQPIAA